MTDSPQDLSQSIKEHTNLLTNGAAPEKYIYISIYEQYELHNDPYSSIVPYIPRTKNCMFFHFIAFFLSFSFLFFLQFVLTSVYFPSSVLVAVICKCFNSQLHQSRIKNTSPRNRIAHYCSHSLPSKFSAFSESLCFPRHPHRMCHWVSSLR